MNYKETLDYIYTQVPMFQNVGAGAYKPGHATTLALSEAFGNTHRALRCIHVGGTNGKGSTAHTIAAVLQSAGYRIGLYTSPHLVDFRERIRVNGEVVPEDFVVDFVAEYLRNPSLVAMHPTFFELTTIMAFKWFELSKVDVAVVEVGLGGRLDSTNIIMPELSVITNISLDHTALLGNTEAEIAVEKAGIIKPGIPVVIGAADGDVREVFVKAAAAAESEIVFASDNPGYKNAHRCADGILYSGTEWGDIVGELSGDCQTENAATVFNALNFLKPLFPDINSEAVRNGFAHVCELTGLAGRWMEIHGEPVKVICDTGHNIGGWRHLGPALKNISAGSTLHMVVGFVNDKDVEAIMKEMPTDAKYYFATPSVTRGRESSSTAAIAAANGLEGTPFPSVAAAYGEALRNANPGDTVFVGGSTFVVADFLADCIRK